MASAWGLALVLLSAGVSNLAAAQSGASASPLVLVVGVGDYSGETYTAGPLPPASYVFFEAEPVTMDVRIANWGTSRATLRVDGRASDELLSASVTRDDVRVHVPLHVPDVVSRELLSGRVNARLDPAMEIEAGDALRWRVAIGDSDLPPGIYRLEVSTPLTDAEGRPVRGRATEFAFEVRARASAEPAELARREAERFTAAGDFAHARPAVARLEGIYPASVAVHLIRGRIADAEGDPETSVRENRTARQYLLEDRDTLFRRYARPGQIEDLMDSLAP
jgi:hypothetical protein